MDAHARISVTKPAATSTPAQSRPTLNQARRSTPTPSTGTGDHVDVPFAGVAAPQPAGSR
ncbi:hypothetical protein [Micromonospora hortensis]|uniref:hypothetical protein n=1 Tax=Micromonospora hortensis TaxID=2911209 RepID=UPI001EE7D9F1|nr:hypothetical protein [Micromonospora hortensis]MCG5447644.1 hypothetical protein [Micromonospora hortensis]